MYYYYHDSVGEPSPIGLSFRGFRRCSRGFAKAHRQNRDYKNTFLPKTQFEYLRLLDEQWFSDGMTNPTRHGRNWLGSIN